MLLGHYSSDRKTRDLHSEYMPAVTGKPCCQSVHSIPSMHSMQAPTCMYNRPALASLVCHCLLLHIDEDADCLQQEVMYVLLFLQVWVITGDKQETAINIAISCKLIRHPDSLLICNADSPEDAARRIAELTDQVTPNPSTPPHPHTLNFEPN